MREIKAFVGHSFNSQDNSVVDAFLKYFQHLEELLPSFSWDHAEKAEPIELAEKVRTKFIGKNIFIGICTAREYAVPDNALSGVFARPDYKKAHRKDYEPKTSDWITQEIGFALGRRSGRDARDE